MDNTISSLTANAALLSNASSNVANLNTTEYKSIDTSLVQGKNDDVQISTRRTQTAGSINTEGEETSNVELSKEFTDMMRAENGYSATLQAIKTRDEMLGSLMEIFS